MSLKKAAYIVLKKCMGLKNNESILVVTDKKRRKLANVFLNGAKKITDKARLIEIKIGKVHGEEPEKKIAKEMLGYDVELLITTKSLSHTKARKNASKKGIRIASMPSITEDVAKRTLDVNYNKIRKLNKKLMKVLTKGKTVRVLTEKGTDLTMSIKGRKCFDDNGYYTKKGRFGNLPCGEIAIAPIEGTTKGILVIDASLSGFGRLKEQLVYHIDNGYVNKINGRFAKKLESLLLNKGYRNIAELGIGTNYKAKVRGVVLEDEKAFNTVHIVIGNNISLGGNVDVPLHIDGVIKKPTVFIDNKKIMFNGKLLI